MLILKSSNSHLIMASDLSLGKNGMIISPILKVTGCLNGIFFKSILEDSLRTQSTKEDSQFSEMSEFFIYLLILIVTSLLNAANFRLVL